MTTKTQLEGPTQPHERLGIWQGGRLDAGASDGFIDGSPLHALGTSIDPDGAPLRAGADPGDSPGASCGSDPWEATWGGDPWDGATPLDPEG